MRAAHLPTKDEVYRLPRWPAVAFAARCAARVEPVFRSARASRFQDDCDAVTNAGVVAAAYASGVFTEDAEASRQRARAAGQLAAEYYGPESAVRKAASAAAYAARAAALARRDGRIPVPAFVDDVVEAALAAWVAGDQQLGVAAAIRADFNTVTAFASRARAKDPLARPSLFPPYWADGEPTGWPDSQVLYDAFISHASEDKEEVARPVAEALRGLGYRVWYDEFELRPGDSLSGAIDRGLNRSRFGVVILSSSFLAKPWTRYEFRGLVAIEMIERPTILPVWHGLTASQVLKFSPALAERLAVRHTSPGQTAAELARRLKAPLHQV